MKLIRKWLFPVLTCLLVAGAALLPQYVSQTRDQRQFGQVHAEELSADALPIYESLNLTDRIMLYCEYSTYQIPILSFRDGSYFYDAPQEKEALKQSVQDQLTQANLLPAWFFEEAPLPNLQIERILLWDPEEEGPWQEPSVFFRLLWSNNDKSHGKHLAVITDAETGLPIRVSVFDTNMSQWLPYDLDHLRIWAERYFDLMGWEAQETSNPSEVWEGLGYLLTGTAIQYGADRQPTTVTVEPDFNWLLRTDAISDSSVYDG